MLVHALHSEQFLNSSLHGGFTLLLQIVHLKDPCCAKNLKKYTSSFSQARDIQKLWLLYEHIGNVFIFLDTRRIQILQMSQPMPRPEKPLKNTSIILKDGKITQEV